MLSNIRPTTGRGAPATPVVDERLGVGTDRLAPPVVLAVGVIFEVEVRTRTLALGSALGYEVSCLDVNAVCQTGSCMGVEGFSICERLAWIGRNCELMLPQRIAIVSMSDLSIDGCDESGSKWAGKVYSSVIAATP
jgi:hypothetical protein